MSDLTEKNADAEKRNRFQQKLSTKKSESPKEKTHQQSDSGWNWNGEKPFQKGSTAQDSRKCHDQSQTSKWPKVELKYTRAYGNWLDTGEVAAG